MKLFYKDENGNPVDIQPMVVPTDETLSKAGRAADAKAVGDAINEQKQDLAGLQTSKQDKLIAGANITIAEDGKTISASGGGGGGGWEVIDEVTFETAANYACDISKPYTELMLLDMIVTDGNNHDTYVYLTDSNNDFHAFTYFNKSLNNTSKKDYYKILFVKKNGILFGHCVSAKLSYTGNTTNMSACSELHSDDAYIKRIYIHGWQYLEGSKFILLGRN